jgi:hypothetical protein
MGEVAQIGNERRFNNTFGARFIANHHLAASKLATRKYAYSQYRHQELKIPRGSTEHPERFPLSIEEPRGQMYMGFRKVRHRLQY